MKLLKAMTMQERFGKLLDVKLICILALVVFFMSGSAYAQEPIRGTGQFIEVDSHADKYLVGQSVAISGKFFDSDKKPLDGSIELTYFRIQSDKERVFGDEEQPSSLQSKNGMFFETSYIPKKSGLYLVEARSDTGSFDSANFNVVEFHTTPQFAILVVSIAALIILLVILSSIKTQNEAIVAKIRDGEKGIKKNITISEFRVARFSLITIITFGMITFFIFSDIEYGRDAPIGIVLHEFAEEKEFDKPLKLDWVLHIGGVSQENYLVGLTIPIYVIIFGVFGGYLRFFHYTANKWLKKEMMEQLRDGKFKIDPETKEKIPYPKEEEFDEIMTDAGQGIIEETLGRVLTNRVMGDLSLLFIAPILAVMMYFVLSQSGLDPTENVWTFAVTSFAAGLFTETVIKKLSDMGKKDELTAPVKKNGD